MCLYFSRFYTICDVIKMYTHSDIEFLNMLWLHYLHYFICNSGFDESDHFWFWVNIPWNTHEKAVILLLFAQNIYDTFSKYVNNPTIFTFWKKKNNLYSYEHFVHFVFSWKFNHNQNQSAFSFFICVWP